MDKQDVKAVILRVTIDGQEIVTEALGESMTGVPATPEMHFRNGAVAISYMATLLLRLVDQNLVTLDDTIDAWLPDLPDAARVTLRMLANMTAGYPDFEKNAGFQEAYYVDPFREWTTEERIAISLSVPRVFAPGTNWDYSHSNYVIMGQALEKITGQPLDVALQEQVLGPSGLQKHRCLVDAGDLRAGAACLQSGSDGKLLGSPPARASMRSPPIGTRPGRSPRDRSRRPISPTWPPAAVAIGEGTLLSPASHQAQIAPDLVGFGAPLEGCPNCRTSKRR